MAEQTAIAWTERTFNPWVGCFKVSDGCKNCYAETLVVNRMKRPGLWGPPKTTQRAKTSVGYWRGPLKWNREAQARGQQMLVFSGSLCDWAEDHIDAAAARPALWQLIRSTPYLSWQLLTKRPERVAGLLPDDWGEGYRNVWLGTSIEDMRVAKRADHLRRIPAAVRFISYEPALGPLDELDLSGIDWVIYGGESGPGYRPHDLAWPRAMGVRCRELGIAWFYKQSAAPRTEMGIELDGRVQRYYPTPRLTPPLPHAWATVPA